MKPLPRRTFVKKSAAGLAGALSALHLGLPVLSACTAPPERKLGVALVGLGSYSTHQLAPALQQTRHCYLAAIVTGTPAKAESWSKKYGIPPSHIYDYETFDRIADNPDVDIVYVVLPNALHAEYTIRAARAGKHVICEKPMATTVEDCKRMIEAVKQAGKLLQIGYRLHYEPHNREVMRLGQERVLGSVNVIESSNAFYGVGMQNWRLDRELAGGGPLMDMGIYCVQGARYTLGLDPLAVTARAFKTHPDQFREVEETLLWTMEFPGGISANCMTSYAARSSKLFVYAEKGNFSLNPAYGYGPLAGEVNGRPMNLPHINQQAAQMDAFALDILEGRPCRVPGEEGLKDLQVIQAIYRAMETGRRVEVDYS